jgi:hypothetical protein
MGEPIPAENHPRARNFAVVLARKGAPSGRAQPPEFSGARLLAHRSILRRHSVARRTESFLFCEKIPRLSATIKPAS